jgi:hypothetical protein
VARLVVALRVLRRGASDTVDGWNLGSAPYASETSHKIGSARCTSVTDTAEGNGVEPDGAVEGRFRVCGLVMRGEERIGADGWG